MGSSGRSSRRPASSSDEPGGSRQRNKEPTPANKKPGKKHQSASTTPPKQKSLPPKQKSPPPKQKSSSSKADIKSTIQTRTPVVQKDQQATESLTVTPPVALIPDQGEMDLEPFLSIPAQGQPQVDQKHHTKQNLPVSQLDQAVAKLGLGPNDGSEESAMEESDGEQEKESEPQGELEQAGDPNSDETPMQIDEQEQPKGTEQTIQEHSDETPKQVDQLALNNDPTQTQADITNSVQPMDWADEVNQYVDDREQMVVCGAPFKWWIEPKPDLQTGQAEQEGLFDTVFYFTPIGMSPRTQIIYAGTERLCISAALCAQNLQIEYILVRPMPPIPAQRRANVPWVIECEPRFRDREFFLRKPETREIIRAFIGAGADLKDASTPQNLGSMNNFLCNFQTMETVAPVLFAQKGEIIREIISLTTCDQTADELIEFLWEFFQQAAQLDAGILGVMAVSLCVHTDFESKLDHKGFYQEAWADVLKQTRSLYNKEIKILDPTVEAYLKAVYDALTEIPRQELAKQSQRRESRRKQIHHKMNSPDHELITPTDPNLATAEFGKITPGKDENVYPFSHQNAVAPRNTQYRFSQGPAYHQSMCGFWEKSPKYGVIVKGSQTVIAELTAQQTDHADTVHRLTPADSTIPGEILIRCFEDKNFVCPPLTGEASNPDFSHFTYDPELNELGRESTPEEPSPKAVEAATFYKWNEQKRSSDRRSPARRVSGYYRSLASDRFSQITADEPLSEFESKLWHAAMYPPEYVDHSWQVYQKNDAVAYKAETEFQHDLWLVRVRTIPVYRVCTQPDRPDVKVLEYTPYTIFNQHYRFADGIRPGMLGYLGGRTAGLNSSADLEYVYVQIIGKNEFRWDLLFVVFHLNVNGNTVEVIRRAVNYFIYSNKQTDFGGRTPRQALEDFLKLPAYAKSSIPTQSGGRNPRCYCMGSDSYCHCPEVCLLLAPYSFVLTLAKTMNICPGDSDRFSLLCVRNREWWKSVETQPGPHGFNQCRFPIPTEDGKCPHCGESYHCAAWCMVRHIQIGTFDLTADDLLADRTTLRDWDRKNYPRIKQDMFADAIKAGLPPPTNAENIRRREARNPVSRPGVVAFTAEQRQQAALMQTLNLARQYGLGKQKRPSTSPQRKCDDDKKRRMASTTQAVQNVQTVATPQMSGTSLQASTSQVQSHPSTSSTQSSSSSHTLLGQGTSRSAHPFDVRDANPFQAASAVAEAERQRRIADPEPAGQGESRSRSGRGNFQGSRSRSSRPSKSKGRGQH